MFIIPSFIGAKQPSTGFVGILDLYPNASWGFSFSRRLTETYTGALFRVRDSGGTEADIGYDSDGIADITALENFANGSRATIVRVYDQSGNGRDLSQTSVSIQPYATDTSGIAYLKNGRYTPYAPIGFYMENVFSQNPIIGQDAWSLFGVSAELQNVTDLAGAIYSWGDFGGGNALRSQIETPSTQLVIRFNNGNNLRNYSAVGSYILGDLFHMGWIYPAGADYGNPNIEGYYNNALTPFVSSVVTIPNLQNTRITWGVGIGSSYTVTANDNFLGEYITYNTYKDAERNDITQNQMDFYGL